MRKRVILCLFGVIPRSINYTYPRIKEKFIEPIRRKHDLKVYVFNLDVGETKVDGMKMNQEDCKIIDADYFEQHLQTDADKEINELCEDGKCVIQGVDYKSDRTKNSLRVMYSEYQISKFLRKKKKEFDYAIVFSADHYPIQELSIPDDMKNVFTSNQGDFLGGYTDGFYMGNLDNIIKIQERYKLLNKLLPTPRNGNHETIFKEGFLRNRITRKVYPLNFLKIRANKEMRIFSKGKEVVEEFEKLQKSFSYKN